MSEAMLGGGAGEAVEPLAQASAVLARRSEGMALGGG